MESFVPESKQLLKRRTASGWDTYVVCKTLVIWYPKILQSDKEHSDMHRKRRVLAFLASIQDYPDDLQDILLLLARRYGLTHAHHAFDNAVRKYLSQRQLSNKRFAGSEARKNESGRLTA